MEIFFDLLVRILPLYVIIAFGVWAARYLTTKKETLAPILIYIISPVVIFNGVYTTEITSELLMIPVVVFILACTISLLFLAISRSIEHEGLRHVLAFSAGTGNTGYFGLPVALALFGQDVLGIVVLAILGFVLFENTLGYAIVTGEYRDVRKTVRKVFRVPMIYAFAAGIVLNMLGVPLGAGYAGIAEKFTGAYTVLGMMIIGMGLAGVRQLQLDKRFFSLSLIAKFIVWPLAVYTLIAIDTATFGIFSETVQQILLLMSLVPLAANTVAYATEFEVNPTAVAVTVLASTLIALIYIPLMVLWLL